MKFKLNKTLPLLILMSTISILIIAGSKQDARAELGSDDFLFTGFMRNGHQWKLSERAAGFGYTFSTMIKVDSLEKCQKAAEQFMAGSRQVDANPSQANKDMYVTCTNLDTGQVTEILVGDDKKL